MSAFLGEVQLLGWSESHNAGAKLALALADPDDLEPFKAMTVRKGKQAGQVLAVLMVEMGDDEEPIVALQRALAGGQVVSRPRKSTEPGESGPSRGDRDRAGTGVATQPEKPKGGPLSKLAGMWCKDPHFQEWVAGVYDKAMGGDGFGTGDIDPAEMMPDEFARHCILVMCKIDSRAALDHDPAATNLFDQKIRLPYHQHLERQRVVA